MPAGCAASEQCRYLELGRLLLSYLAQLILLFLSILGPVLLGQNFLVGSRCLLHRALICAALVPAVIQLGNTLPLASVYGVLQLTLAVGLLQSSGRGSLLISCLLSRAIGLLLGSLLQIRCGW